MKDLHILLVDTDVASMESVNEALTTEQYTVHKAHNAKEALDVLKTVHAQDVPVVVVLCLSLAAEFEFALLQEIKNCYPQLQVILTSQEEEHEHLSAQSLIGAYTIMPKPINIQQLINHLSLSLMDKMEGSLVAASMAQAGAFEAADHTMEEMETMEEISEKVEEKV